MSKASDVNNYPEIDGLRAVAVFSVIGFHLGLPGFGLGWAGVQLFFCISGFLITEGLRATKNRTLGTYLYRFFVRRALRILPAYYSYLTLALLLRWILVRNIDGWFYFVIYANNYYQAFHGFQHSMLLSHLWSLAVEEQFYLLWPCVVFLATSNSLFKISIGLVVIAPLIRFTTVSYTSNVTWEYASLLASADCLALGALYALRPTSWKMKLPSWFVLMTAAVAGLLTIEIYHIGYSKMGDAQLWVASAQSHFLLTAVGIICIGMIGLSQTNLYLKTILSRQWLTHLGRISYGLYLFHPLTFTVCTYVGTVILGNKINHGAGHVLLIAAEIFCVVGIATASYRWMERRFLMLKHILAP